MQARLRKCRKRRGHHHRGSILHLNRRGRHDDAHAFEHIGEALISENRLLLVARPGQPNLQNDPDIKKLMDAVLAGVDGLTTNQNGKDVTIKFKMDVPADALRNLIKNNADKMNIPGL